jgi:hypothetical protein
MIKSPEKSADKLRDLIIYRVEHGQSLRVEMFRRPQVFGESDLSKAVHPKDDLPDREITHSHLTRSERDRHGDLSHRGKAYYELTETEHDPYTELSKRDKAHSELSYRNNSFGYPKFTLRVSAESNVDEGQAEDRSLRLPIYSCAFPFGQIRPRRAARGTDIRLIAHELTAFTAGLQSHNSPGKDHLSFTSSRRKTLNCARPE